MEGGDGEEGEGGQGDSVEAKQAVGEEGGEAEDDCRQYEGKVAESKSEGDGCGWSCAALICECVEERQAFVSRCFC